MIKHGMQKSPEYATWERMKTRCYNPKSDSYQNYGGRGVKVCDNWRGSFQNFYRDLGPKPSRDHSIERIDSDGDYEPSNCRWATRIEQDNNKRNNVAITINGKRKNIIQWANEMGVNPNTLRSRIRAGWSGEETIKTKIRPLSRQWLGRVKG